jgi:serine/alanine adding enzyme
MSSVTVERPHGYTRSPAQTQEGIRVVQRLDENDWRRFVDGHPQGNIFHTPEMFQVFSHVKGFHPTQWAAVRGDGQIEALFLPVQVTLHDLLRPLTTRAISYGSVLCLPSNEGRQALSLLLKTYVRRNRKTCLFTELRNVSDLENEQPLLLEQGFLYEEHLNYLIDLKRTPEDVFLGIGARTRKNIRHGLNKGEVTIREATEPEQIDACYDLLSQTYQAARVPLADRSLFDAAFNLLHPQKMIRFTLAYVGDAPAAASVDLLYKDVIYGWYGGMDRAYSRYVPNEMLMWHLLKWGSENGFSLYDFGGAGSPDEEYGVRDFKAKFGGNLVCYGRNTYVHMPAALWLSKQGYRVMRHLFKGRFPG